MVLVVSFRFEKWVGCLFVLVNVEEKKAFRGDDRCAKKKKKARHD